MITTFPKKQRGVTLPELMISLGLGLFLISGAIIMLLSSKQTYTSNQSLSILQENGRYALNFLINDIRNSGYKGMCISNPTNHVASDIDSSIWIEGHSLHGWNNDTPTYLDESIVNNSDVLLVQYGASRVLFPGDLNNSANNNEINFGSGEFSQTEQVSVIISDALGCDFFTPSLIGDSSISKQNSAPWSHDYGEGFEILSMNRIIYYLALDSNNDNIPTLFKARLNDDASFISNEPIIPNISALNFSYGVLANNGTVTNYSNANQITNWDRVGTVRVALTVTDTNNINKNFNTIVSIRNQLR